MPESSVQEAVLRLARQLKLIPTAPPGNPGPAYHPGPEWPVQSLSDAASVPAQFFGELLRGLMDPLGANNQAPVENIGALLGAAMPLASGLRGLRAGQLAEEAATAGRAAKGAQGIKAYHGSPHDFDQFQMSKIGTGEGAQAYGHGLYFAENKGVAQNYRDALASREAATLGGRPIADVERELRAAQNSKSITDAAYDANQQKLEFLAYLRDPNFVGTVDDAIRDSAREAPEIAAWVKSQGYKPGGRMYEVNLKVDPEQLLDWDKPLSQQGATGKRVASMIRPDRSAAEQIAGAKRTLEQYPQTKAYQRDPEAGERYLDQVRTHLKSLNDTSVMSGKDAWENIVKQNNMLPPVASRQLAKRGIPGLKYLDGGSRAAGEGSRNYVIFDDSLVDILKKYGVALPAIEVLRRKAQANNGTVPANDVHGLIGS